MEKRVIIGLVAGVMALSVLSCAKEQQKDNLPENPNGLITEVLSATKEGDATKVTMNSSRQFGWSTSDQVAFTINDGTGTYYFKESDTYGKTIAEKFTVSYPETHTRTGYAVIPSTFAGGYDGSTLTVTYPETYDISADMDGGCYDNADAAHFIPFPMVSVSDPESAALTFYSIGALAKVSVSAVPAGTKNLYITFNKPVTGNFTVVGPATATPQVSCSGEANTTVTVTISESGLASQQNIVLYIPIPVCDNGLTVLTSSTAPKLSMARNKGYAFAISAITSKNNDQPYFTLGGDLYEIAPGNLSNTYGYTGTWSFLDNQVKTQLTLHTVTPTTKIERDVFRFNELKNVFYNTSSDEDEVYPYTLGGQLGTSLAGKDGTSHDDWKLMSEESISDLFFNNNSTGVVGTTDNAHYARILVDVSDSAYESYAMLDESFTTSGSPKKYVYGMILFPNDYYDITDLISADINGVTGNNTREGKSIIPYEAFDAMADAGAIFLVAAGRYSGSNGGWYDTQGNGNLYMCSATATSSSNCDYFNGVDFRTVSRETYMPRRLIRAISAPAGGDTSVSQGDNWSWD